MDDDVEARLREALRLHAAESPPGATMLSAVRTIAVRRRRRLHTSWAAAVVVLGVLSAAAVPGMLDRPRPAAPSPAIVHSTLTVGAPLAVTFPYTLAGATPVIAAGHPTLRDKDLEIWTTPTAPGGASPSPARTFAGGELFWSDRPGRWLVVAGPGSRNELSAMADALAAVPSTGAVPFTFALVPDGYSADNIDSAVVTWCPPEVVPSADFLGKIAVMLDAATTDATPRPLDPGDEVVAVGDHKAVLSRRADGVTLSIPQPDGRTLVVQDTMTSHLSEQDLIDFAAGIGITTAATTSLG